MVVENTKTNKITLMLSLLSLALASVCGLVFLVTNDIQLFQYAVMLLLYTIIFILVAMI